jgi:hypothetical protein
MTEQCAHPQRLTIRDLWTRSPATVRCVSGDGVYYAITLILST